MKCSYCGYEIPKGKLSCDNCGKELFVVPDYNPLDDMLAEQVKVSVNGGRDNDELDISQGAKNRSSARRTTGRVISEREKKRRHVEKRKAARRKRRRRFMLIFLMLFIAAGGGGIILYQNSYNGIINKGYKAINAHEYDRADAYFQKAILKNGERPEAYTGLSKVYREQNEMEKAEALFEQAIEKYPENAGIYRAYVEYLLDVDLVMEIPVLLDEAADSVKDALDEYIIDVPEFDLDEEKVYDDVQQLTISAAGDTVYFTTDESTPSPQGQKYTEPVQLVEGENIIKAIAVNKKGIPSMTVQKTYVIEFPVIDAPAVSPSTGQYESAQKIEIKVPEGYEAYYTMDGQEPTTASKKYTGSVDMPEGETLFKAVLVSARGRASSITTRNYQLNINSDEE